MSMHPGDPRSSRAPGRAPGRAERQVEQSARSSRAPGEAPGRAERQVELQVEQSAAQARCHDQLRPALDTFPGCALLDLGLDLGIFEHGVRRKRAWKLIGATVAVDMVRVTRSGCAGRMASLSQLAIAGRSGPYSPVPVA